MAAFTRLLCVIFLLGLDYEAASTQQCNGPRQLKRHIYETRKARSGHAECLFVCREKNLCQSFNFVIAKSVCEFNNRTKEASPKDFVDDPDRYYVKLDVSRVTLGSIPELPAKSCREIKLNEGGQAASQKYWFYSVIPGTTVLAYCDMKLNDIDECSVSPSLCHHNATCKNNVGSYVCSCKEGFTGNGKTCIDINECSTSPSVCHRNADCTNNIGSYVCSCKVGFTGNGKTCNDINECITSPSVCHRNADCRNGVGSYVCSCKMGFAGDGKTCSDINECITSPSVCHRNADCRNDVGSYVCSCKKGFAGDGKTCSDVNECVGNHGCDVNAYCTNTPGSYSCTCSMAYDGDGKRCTLTRGLQASSILNRDSRYREKVISYLAPVVQSSSRSWFKRCWSATTDGWAASTFHSNCDGKGPSVTIIRVDSYIFGGYSDLSWYSYTSCSYARSTKAFIFSLYNIYGYNPVKREITESSRYDSAVYRCYDRGPAFGNGHDIKISDNAASDKESSYTFCGNTYPLPSGYSSSGSSCRFYAGGSNFRFTPTDVEVFYEITTEID